MNAVETQAVIDAMVKEDGRLKLKLDPEHMNLGQRYYKIMLTSFRYNCELHHICPEDVKWHWLYITSCALDNAYEAGIREGERRCAETLSKNLSTLLTKPL